MAHILIVEDRPYLRELLSEELAHAGYQVESVGDAASIWRHLIDSRPDMVLLDLYLNGFEGWDVLRDIKSKYPHLPVMILTACDSLAEDPQLSQTDLCVIRKVLLLLMAQTKNSRSSGVKHGLDWEASNERSDGNDRRRSKPNKED